MKSFLQYIKEVVELSPPKSIETKSIKTDFGYEYDFSFRTSMNNNVSVKFICEKEGSCEVNFYVNHSMGDDSSNLPFGAVRDKEILSNVFHTIKQKLDELKINELKFVAVDGNKEKELRGYALQGLQAKGRKLKDALIESSKASKEQNVIGQIKMFLYTLPQMFEAPMWSFNERIINEFRNFLYNDKKSSGIQNISNIRMLMDDFLETFHKAKEDYHSVRNRRSNIYNKVLERNFSQDWKIHQEGDIFFLERK